MNIAILNPIFSTLYQIHTNPEHPFNLCGDLETLYHSIGMKWEKTSPHNFKLAQIEKLFSIGTQVYSSFPAAPDTYLLMALGIFAGHAYEIFPCSTTRELSFELKVLSYQNAQNENPEIFEYLTGSGILDAAKNVLKTNQDLMRAEDIYYGAN